MKCELHGNGIVGPRASIRCRQEADGKDHRDDRK
jgi:hypothetical protein